MSNNTKNSSHYDVVKAAPGYANLASVLAGFAFAAVILVVQEAASNSNNYLREQVAVAFIIAFFGCLLASFSLSLVVGEEKADTRAYIVALPAATVFSIGAMHIFWGLVILTKRLNSDMVNTLVDAIFFVAAVVTPLFLIFTATDAQSIYNRKILSDDSKKALKGFGIIVHEKYGKLLTSFCYLPIIIGLVAKALFPLAQSAQSSLFSADILASVGLLGLGALISILLSEAESNLIPRFKLNMIWVILHCCILGLLFFILQ